MGRPLATAVKALLTLLTLLILLALLVAAMGREKSLEVVFGTIKVHVVDFPSLVLTPNPNQFLVCPADYCAAKPNLISPIFAVPADQLRTRWIAMIAAQPRIEAGAVDEGALQYDFVQRSDLMRYPGSITVRFIPLDRGRSTLAVYSRSHYGRNDFGVNEARIRAWLAALGR